MEFKVIVIVFTKIEEIRRFSQNYTKMKILKLKNTKK